MSTLSEQLQEKVIGHTENDVGSGLVTELINRSRQLDEKRLQVKDALQHLRDAAANAKKERERADAEKKAELAALRTALKSKPRILEELQEAQALATEVPDAADVVVRNLNDQLQDIDVMLKMAEDKYPKDKYPNDLTRLLEFVQFGLSADSILERYTRRDRSHRTPEFIDSIIREAEQAKLVKLAPAGQRFSVFVHYQDKRWIPAHTEDQVPEEYQLCEPLATYFKEQSRKRPEHASDGARRPPNTALPPKEVHQPNTPEDPPPFLPVTDLKHNGGEANGEVTQKEEAEGERIPSPQLSLEDVQDGQWIGSDDPYAATPAVY